MPTAIAPRSGPRGLRWLRTIFTLVIVLVVAAGAAWLVREWLRAPSRWKDAATPPPGFEQALAEFDAGRTEAGLSRLREVRRRWTHPLWDRRIGFLQGWWNARLQKLQPGLIAFRAAGDPTPPDSPARDRFCLGPLAALSQASLLLRLDRPGEAARLLDPLSGRRDLPWRDDLFETWARATGEDGRPGEALSRIEQALSAGTGDPRSLRLLAGRLRQKAGDSAGAAEEFKRVWCEWPREPESDRAAEALAALPPPHHDWTLHDVPLLAGRADRLAEAGDTAGAIDVWTRAREEIAGAAQDPGVRVHLGAAYAEDGREEAARPLLQPLPADPALASLARRALARIELDHGRLTKARDLLQPDLRGRPEARREAALLLATGADRLEKDAEALGFYDIAVPLMTASDDRDQAAWRAGWLAFRQRKFDRAITLFATLDREGAHPGFRSAALYWTGRAQQARGGEAAGRRLLESTLDRFRNDYYGLRASERLGHPRPLAVRRRIPPADPPDATAAALDPAAGLDPGLFPPSSRLAIAAGEELARLHLEAEAARALEFAAPLAPSRDIDLRLADLALRRGDRTAALPWLRAAWPDLVRVPDPGLPSRAALALYPVDHWSEIRAAAAARSLDPWLVCSVILQESAFNPLAVSRAGACGLMQVLPDTSQDLARQMGLGPGDRQRLFDPKFNVLVGSRFLSDLLDRYDGHLEPALAAYNAGSARADRWWPASGRDPERFVEDIPFIETRLYVKRIVSQWWMYRLLYDGAR